MNNQLPVDRQLLIPILIGVISVLGIIIVLLVGLLLNSPAEIPATPTETPFEYLFIGTEPGISTPLLEESETVTPTLDTSALTTPTRSSVATAVILSPSGVRNTATPAVQRTNTPGSAAAASNTYDDTDAGITYLGTWVSQTNVPYAHDSTLHVSTGIGNSVAFTFTGTEIHLFYQAAPGLGTVTIAVDASEAPLLSQDNSDTQIEEWVSDPLPNGTHQIVISHFAGGSVNIDALYVQVPTPTPSRTPTSSQ